LGVGIKRKTFRDLRTRPDERHLASKNIDQLWQLIDLRSADESADPCDPLVVALG
jgi:hypothetical protein